MEKKGSGKLTNKRTEMEKEGRKLSATKRKEGDRKEVVTTLKRQRAKESAKKFKFHQSLFWARGRNKNSRTHETDTHTQQRTHRHCQYNLTANATNWHTTECVCVSERKWNELNCVSMCVSLIRAAVKVTPVEKRSQAHFLSFSHCLTRSRKNITGSGMHHI